MQSRRHDEKLIIELAPPKSLLAILAMLSPLDEDFPEIDDPVREPINLKYVIRSLPT